VYYPARSTIFSLLTQEPGFAEVSLWSADPGLGIYLQSRGFFAFIDSIKDAWIENNDLCYETQSGPDTFHFNIETYPSREDIFFQTPFSGTGMDTVNGICNFPESMIQFYQNVHLEDTFGFKIRVFSTYNFFSQPYGNDNNNLHSHFWNIYDTTKLSDFYVPPDNFENEPQLIDYLP